MELRIYCQQENCSTGTLVSADVSFMGLFTEVPKRELAGSSFSKLRRGHCSHAGAVNDAGFDRSAGVTADVFNDSLRRSIDSDLLCGTRHR